MKVNISSRHNVPSTNLFVDIITKDNNPLGANGRKVMILAPGGPGGNHTVYKSIKDELVEFADLILFDPRGCGYSDKSPANYCTLNHYIDDIEALRSFFGLEKFILLGGSYGSIAALGYATKYPNFLEKLILISGGMADSNYLQTVQKNLEERGSPEQLLIAKHLWNGTFKNAEHFAEYYKIMAPLYIYNYEKNADNNVPATESHIPYNVEITNLGFSDFLKKFDFKSDLNKIDCETLIIAGNKDWIIDLSMIKQTAQEIQKCDLNILENCGHFVWVDQPDAFFKILNEFFKQPEVNPYISQQCRM